MYAVVRTGGKQYRVEEGRPIKVDRLAGEPGDTVELGEVLLMADGDAVTVGAPAIEGARVLGEIAEQGRGRKIVVFRYKAKTRSRKLTGHRQHFTRLIVRDILAAGQEPKAREAPPAPAAEEPAPTRARRGIRRRKAEPAATVAGEEPEAAAAPPEGEGASEPEATTPLTEAELPEEMETADALDAAPVAVEAAGGEAEAQEPQAQPEKRRRLGRRKNTES